MARYISIDDAIKIVTKAMEFGDYNKLIAVSNALYEAPAADVVEVVRCKDCKYFRLGFDVCRHDLALNCCNRDDFCSYGERKE